MLVLLPIAIRAGCTIRLGNATTEPAPILTPRGLQRTKRAMFLMNAGRFILAP
jgi:hypothetical protein